METPLDDFHAHEALDRCDMMISILSDHLLGHPYVVTHPEILALMESAGNQLAEAYQLIGTAHMGRTDD